MKDLALIFDEIPKKRVIVLGDLMLDHYIEGKLGKMSPEAPIQIISAEKEWFAPGGAGNTAVNVSALGASAIFVGEIGTDKNGRKIEELLFRHHVDLQNQLWGSGLTTVKLRIISEGKQIVRVDKDFVSDIWNKTVDILRERLNNIISNCDALLVSDYAKGRITKEFARKIVGIASEYQKMLIVDTKPKHFEWFKGCYCIKPNKIEAEEFSGIKIESLEDAKKAGNFIKKALETNVLLTLGSMGMMLFEQERTTHFTSSAKEVFDVTGAGDTVLATFSLALCAGASIRQAVDLANHAAALVIAKPGTASVSLKELKKSLT